MARSEPYRLRIVLPLLPGNAAENITWKAKLGRQRRVRKLIAGQLWGRRREMPLQFARITCTRYSTTCPDAGNLPHGFKEALDTLRAPKGREVHGFGIIQDDDPDHTIQEYRWEKAARGEGSMVIEIEEIACEALEAERVDSDTGEGEIVGPGGSSRD